MIKLKLPQGAKVISEHKGYKIKKGKKAGQYTNPYWLIKDKNGSEYYIMYCNKGKFTKFSKKSLPKLLKFQRAWYVDRSGYIACCNTTYMHQLVMNYKGYGKGGLSVDHINKDKSDNRLSNLRLATQSEQNKNKGKMERRYDAQKLPHGIKSLPKYITYNTEKISRADGSFYYREFFRIEHPSLAKRWNSSKSMKVPIKQKYQDTLKALNRLNKLTKN